MKLNLNSITSKLASNAKTIGKLYGYLGPMAARGGDDPLGYIMANHERAFNALLQGKIPKVQNIVAWMRGPEVMGILKTALTAYIVGEVGGGFIGSRNATALKNFAVEAAKFTVLSSAVTTWHWNPHPPAGMGGGSGGKSEAWKYQP